MKELRDILALWGKHQPGASALATLVQTSGSSYRRPGARMLITSSGEVAGGLSAGCIEDEVALHAREVIASGQPKLVPFDTRRRFGCHGSIEIFIQRTDDEFMAHMRERVAARESCEVVTHFGSAAPLVQIIQPPLRLLVIGEVADADALAKQAQLLGWDVHSVAAISELRVALDDRTAVVIATHNFGRDGAALHHLLPLGLPYVGLIGPRRRREELLRDVLDHGAAMKSQLFAPAGLHLAAETPEEIALSIIAEIQAVFAGGTAQHLRDRKAPIHTPRRMRVVGAVILAAGASTRLGEPKQFLSFEGETLLRRVTKAAHEAGCAPVVVIAGDLGDRVRAELHDLPVQVVHNAEWRSGIGTSIKRGVAHVRHGASAIMMLTCDQPFVSAEIIRKLCREDHPIVASGYAGTVGIPALFDARYFDELESLPDATGAKSLIEAHAADLAVVPFPEGVTDVDTRADYKAVAASDCANTGSKSSPCPATKTC